MYSEELMTYLYSYNMPSKKEEDKNKKTLSGKFIKETPILHVLRSASVTVPLDFNNEVL